MAKKVEEKVDQFAAWAQKHPGKRGQVRVVVVVVVEAVEAGLGQGCRVAAGPPLSATATLCCCPGQSPAREHSGSCPPPTTLAGVPVVLREAPAPELVQVGTRGLCLCCFCFSAVIVYQARMLAGGGEGLAAVSRSARLVSFWAAPPVCCYHHPHHTLAPHLTTPPLPSPLPPPTALQRSTAEERLYWEQWLVDVAVAPAPPAEFEERDAAAASALSAQRRQRVQAAIEECLTLIVQHGEGAGGEWVGGGRGGCH